LLDGCKVKNVPFCNKMLSLTDWTKLHYRYRMITAGIFITFEGGDGSGKSTQIKLLAQTLQAMGKTVVLTQNPGGSPLGQQLRDILLHHQGPVDPMAELLLYMADRAQHVATVIQPALAQGHVVLCDRYTDSTVAYQGWGRQLDAPMINTLNQWATGGLVPKLTLLLDGDPAVLRQRVAHRGKPDRLEGEALVFHQAVRQGYLALASQAPQRIRVVPATDPIETVQATIQSAVMQAIFT
jgi:dTMP kinase